MTTGLQFDEATHTYTLNGEVLPSVSTIIRECLGSGFEFMAEDHKEWVLQRGRAVHAAVKMMAEGMRFEFDQQIAGQMEAARKWFADVKPLVLATEIQMATKVHRFAGTADLVCEIQGRNCLVDYKATVEPVRLACQLGAYSVLDGSDINTGFGVTFGADGRYVMTRPICLKRARHEFLALRTAYRLREQLGMLESQKKAKQRTEQ